MPKKKTEKKIIMLEPNFSDILVCQKKDKRPFIEIFTQTPENINQQNLGVLAGIFEITEESEDSSYIVNYLISVIKKEYFSNTKRGTIESFESALHKANLAMSKLAEHGNVDWIGNLNAIVLVCEKNNIHLSQTGKSYAYLVRAKNLVTICESQEENSNDHPLKTFEDVMSGRLQKDDKIVATTETIFNIFSVEEIKRGSVKFSREAFIQFLHTALINELERAAVLVIDIDEKQEAELAKPVKKAKKINAFSQRAFVSPPQEKVKIDLNTQDKKEITDELNREFRMSQEEFIDEKTGHIYIKDDGQSTQMSLGQKFSNFIEAKKTNWEEKVGSLEGRVTNLSSRLQARYDNKIKSEPDTEIKEIVTPKLHLARNKAVAGLNKIKPMSVAAAFYAKAFLTNRIYQPLKYSSQKLIHSSNLLWKRVRTGNKLNRYSKLPRESQKLLKKALNKAKNLPIKKPKSIDTTDTTNYAINPESLSATRQEKKEWLKNLSDLEEKKDSHSAAPQEILETNDPNEISPDDYLSIIRQDRPTKVTLQDKSREVILRSKQYGKKFIRESLTLSQSIVKAYRNISSKAEKSIYSNDPSLKSYRSTLLPSISRIKNIILTLPNSKKLYAGAVVILVFVVPYFIVKFQNSPEEKNEPQILGETTPLVIPLEQDKNVVRLDNLSEVYSGTQDSQLVEVNDKKFIVEKTKIVDLEDKSTYDIPVEFQGPELITEMDDLNLIFLLKDNNTISFSASAKKFQTNNIAIPENSTISSAASYLTYLYLVDNKNNQIYRYPRAEGGFGQAANWLKDDIDISNANALAINEDVFLVLGNKIEKLSKGKKQNFSPEESTTPISADKLYVKPEFNNIYLLDKTNARIVTLDKDGRIIKQYYHADLAEGRNLVVSEENRKVTVLLENKVVEFDLN